MVVDSEYQPILVVPCVMSKKKIKFLLPDEEKVVSGDWLKFTKRVLGLCNGTLSVADIASLLGANEVLVIEILKNLDADGIITDSREQYKHFNRVDSFPTAFTQSKTQAEIARHHEIAGYAFESDEPKKRVDLKLFELLEKRRSCRDFLPKEMTLTQIRTLCQAGYSKLSSGHVTVPSAGGLYPLSIYVSVPKQMNEFADVVTSGYYLFDPSDDSLEMISEGADIERLKYCFNNEDMIDNTIQIVIAANIDFMGFKYANRAYRFCLLEAGHVAQNITLAAIEMGLATCEMGGVLDTTIKKEMKIAEGEAPLLAMVVGYPGMATEPFDYFGLVEKNVGVGKPVSWLSTSSDCGDFYTATAEYDNGFGPSIANGRARSAAVASLKALMEGYERHAMYHYSDAQNSCGFAANFCREDAKLAAKLELIERDAIMRCWESKIPPVKFTPKSIHAVRWMHASSKNHADREFVFLKMNSPLALDFPVVLVAISGSEYPYFVCGACCDPDQEKAENQALMEAMSALSYYARNPENAKAPKLRDIETAEDHGALYRLSKKANKQIAWLMDGKYAEKPFADDPQIPSDEELGISYRTIREYSNGIIVVQALSTKLIPMSFGTNGQDVFPHFFA